MKIILYVGVGSFLGGIGRYLLSGFVQTRFGGSFPFGTMLVNIVGCFLIGVVYGWSTTINLSAEWRLFLTTGLLGGFTTFSAFSFEAVTMLRDGTFISAILYLLISIVVGLSMTLAGLTVVKIMS